MPPGWAEQFVKEAFLKYIPKLPDTQETPEVISICDDIPEATAFETVVASVSRDVENTSINVDVPKDSGKQIELQSYNGQAFDTYSWSQTVNELDLIVLLPESANTKNLVINVKPQSIAITLKNSDMALIEGDLREKVKHTEIIWSIQKRELNVHLEKCLEMWWDCFLTIEPRLDVAKIDCSRPFEDLSDEAQAKIEELTWNQERKRLGLPTSDEMAMHNKLKMAWNAKGSPFKGQPFDPSSVVIN